MEELIVTGSYILPDSETVISEGAIYIRDSIIIETGASSSIIQKYPDVRVIGNDRYIVMPGLVNAHSHGKGITDFQRGQTDDSLETWKWRVFPPIDQHLDTLYFAVKCIESGITTTMHNHNIQNPENPEEECRIIADAYRETGLKVCFSPVLACTNPFIYGDNEAFIASLPAELEESCRKVLARTRLFGPKEYFTLHNHLDSLTDDSSFCLFHGPQAPQWVDDDSLVLIAEDSLKRGIPLHIHTQQTRLQELYGYRTYGTSLITHLKDLGVLEAKVTCGHCVWVSDEDIDILAETETSVTHHPACNLRIRNGIAPVDRFCANNITVALGMDDKDMNDNRDFIEEIRLASRLHRVNACLPDSQVLGSRDFFKMATENGAKVLGRETSVGKLHPGMKADMILVDLTRMSEPFVSPDTDIFDLLLYRAKSTDVSTVIIDGRIIMKDRKLLHLNRNDIVHSLSESIPENYSELFRTMNSFTLPLRSHISRYYEIWCKNMDDSCLVPYYIMNGRRNDSRQNRN